jgi:hypothetical protein
MIPQIYADGFSNISFVNGMVRIDLASTPPGAVTGGTPAPAFAQTRWRVMAVTRLLRLHRYGHKTRVNGGSPIDPCLSTLPNPRDLQDIAFCKTLP